MQVDTGNDVFLIPRYFRNKMDKPELRKINLQLKQFDEMRKHFWGTFERKNRFESISITMVTYNKY